MTRTTIAALVLLLVGVGWMAVARVRGEEAEQKPVLAKPSRTEESPKPGPGDEAAPPSKPAPPSEPAPPKPGPDITPPPPMPDVEIPPIPEVDKDPFKPGPRPRRVGPPDVIEEGKRLFNREGRLELDPIGRATFVFDSADKPMWLLENSWREFLENVTEYGKKKARWRVSGIVTVYGKQNYLLLMNVTRIMPEEEAL